MCNDLRSNNLLHDMLHLSTEYSGIPDWIYSNPKLLDADAVLHASGDPTPDRAERLLRERTTYALFSKNADFGTPAEDRETVAINKFKLVISRNRIFRKKLRYYFSRPSRMPHDVALVLGHAQSFLQVLLGSHPTEEDWDRAQLGKVFSSGSSLGLGVYKGYKDVNPYAKILCDSPTVSAACAHRFFHFLVSGPYGDYLRESKKVLAIRNYSRVTTVPKDQSSDRVIAVEPLLNGSAQHALATMLDPYLRSIGIDLRDQSRQRRRAKYASIKGFHPQGHSTIDLSSASDTITKELVQYLFPRGWSKLLFDASTPKIQFGEGESMDSEMFATMGNATTFPVQCLVFYSLAHACNSLSGMHGTVSVYGDDIIVPTSASLLLLESLRFVGCKPNTEKSHIIGFFRESCGGDYLGGYDVRPVFLRGDPRKARVRFSYFNALQRKLPDHPVLYLLYNYRSDPLVGPALHPNNPCSTHFEAPLFALKRRKGVLISWDRNIQAYRYSFPRLFDVSRKVKRRSVLVRYLSDLLGYRGIRHDLRGSAKETVKVVTTSTPWILPTHSPLWYFER